MKFSIPSLILIFCLLGTFSVFAQYEKEWLQNMSEEDYQQAEVLVMYPAATRKLMLEAAQQPNALLKIKHIQQQTSTSFQQLLEDYPQEDQKAIWDLTRYPGLIHGLAFAEPGTVSSVLADYPEVIHQRARAVAAKHPDLLQQISSLQKNSETILTRELKDYPANTVEALHQLVDLPEVISILTEHIELTMVAGEAYRKFPDWVTSKADSLHLALAQQQAQELEDWKSSTNTNPEALSELKASSQAYAKEAEYDDDYYEDYEEDYFVDETVVIHHYYSYHYPYWFGYPNWYHHPRWRPYPWWYDWGFYVHTGRPIVIFSIPSYHCVNWYFYHSINHYHYPHLSSHFAGHYYGHRHTGSSIVRNVDRWKRDNKGLVKDRSLEVAENRSKWFRDFGKLEKDHQEYQKDNKRNVLSKADYLAANQDRYPQLEPVTTRPSQGQKPPRNPKNTKVQPDKPHIEKNNIPKTKVPKTDIPTRPKTDRPTPPKTKVPKVSTPKKPKVDRPAPPKTQAPKVSTPKKPKVNRSTPPKTQEPKVSTPKKPKVNQPAPPKAKAPKTTVPKSPKVTKTTPRKTGVKKKE